MQVAILLLVAAVLISQWIILTRRGKDAGQQLGMKLTNLENSVIRNEQAVREEMSQNRMELGNNLKGFNDSLLTRMTEVMNLQQTQQEIFARQLNQLTQSNEQRLDKMRETVEQQLGLLRDDNAKKLEEMRTTVDEKLHATLEQRLGESFKLVSERLEQVHKGLGEMQTLANGVGDLKRVLTNVKARGNFGEIQLASLLEQVLAREQYETNVSTKKGSSERVEFAIKLPGHDAAEAAGIWLPIDAKFPVEDYQRLLDALDEGDPMKAEMSGKALENRIKAEAKDIRDKYLDPPNTTDFGIMFLPTEGLYAEVLRRPGLCDALQKDFRVVITGPTTLLALLNSLQMGFRTLAIEKRSSEVWVLLGAVKTEFGKFGDLLDKTHKKLQEASNSIETAARKSRTIERKLRGVEQLPPAEAAKVIGEGNPGEDEAV
ncbi:DNA recombination RmuC [Acididesulfobacillus acetoxydans]|uniref:DNA recombination RmuC n=1 Tax=Acididesulfobacillus acetoxydans TaxID=1561005 RepID=A0A8S0WA76_9FIRM|nr:DNA recombination protein RmuC [Acididesulfobacillus acetoxydans]CAA7603209.1 DNA recombination RmuC [Acididesulfobacillus acetoxydans]